MIKENKKPKLWWYLMAPAQQISNEYAKIRLGMYKHVDNICSKVYMGIETTDWKIICIHLYDIIPVFSNF